MKQTANDRKYLVIVIVVFIIALIFLSFLLKDINSNTINNNTIIDNSEYEINDILLNGFDLKKEHCIDDVCIKDLNLYYSVDSVSFISGIVYNKGIKSKDKCLRFTFNNQGTEPFYLQTCFSDITPNDEFDFELQFDHNELSAIIGIDNYELSEY